MSYGERWASTPCNGAGMLLGTLLHPTGDPQISVCISKIPSGTFLFLQGMENWDFGSPKAQRGGGKLRHKGGLELILPLQFPSVEERGAAVGSSRQLGSSKTTTGNRWQRSWRGGEQSKAP